VISFGDARLPDRFWSKVSPCPMSGCWLWFAFSDSKGYGRFTIGRPVLAHRHAFMALVGPIPDDAPHLDHKCRVTSCVNPAHLEPVTNAENTRRGISGQQNAEKTHCPHGHAYEGENLFFIPNKTRSRRSRCCRVCKNIRNANWRYAKRLRPLSTPNSEVAAHVETWMFAAMIADAVPVGAVTRKTKTAIEVVPAIRLLKESA
jgi:hypothetical protein